MAATAVDQIRVGDLVRVMMMAAATTIAAVTMMMTAVTMMMTVAMMIEPNRNHAAGVDL